MMTLTKKAYARPTLPLPLPVSVNTETTEFLLTSNGNKLLIKTAAGNQFTNYHYVEIPGDGQVLILQMGENRLLNLSISQLSKRAWLKEYPYAIQPGHVQFQEPRTLIGEATQAPHCRFFMMSLNLPGDCVAIEKRDERIHLHYSPSFVLVMDDLIAI